MRFAQLQLRTTDLPAARAFYGAVLGAAPEVVPLPPQAAARGAVPHWLGFIGVDDVARTADAYRARGATQLGGAAVFRDPGGAVVGLAPPGGEAPSVWHLLHTAGVEAAKDRHAALFGWSFGPPEDRGALGVFHPFAWTPGGATVGAMVDLAGRPHLHPHWLFHFPVADAARAADAVRAEGGTVAGVFELGEGVRVAVCEDAQRAAFALRSA